MKSQILNFRRQLGQGMTEYIIIVALIAVSAIGVYTMFGEVVKNQTAAIAAELGGGDGTDGNTRAGKAGDESIANAKQDATLSNFSTTNTATVK